MQQWVYNVEMDIRSLEKIFVFGLKWRNLLVLDNATAHKTSKVKEKKIQRMWYIVVNDTKWANMKISALRHLY